MTTNLPETPAPPAELPRRDPLASACATARTITCTHCGAEARRWCDRLDGCHLRRFVRAYIADLLTPAEIEAVVQAAGDVFTDATVIRAAS